MKKSIATILVFLCTMMSSDAQLDDIRYSIQLAINVGTPVNSMGVNFTTEYLKEPTLEIAVGGGLVWNFSNYGPKTPHLEARLIGSIHYLWGDKDFIKKDMPYIKYIDSGNAGNSFGYTWERYFNKLGTSQNVGTIHFRVENVVFQFSNDVFANTTGDDRFRTGAFGMGFIEDRVYYHTRLLIWSGDSRCQKVKKYRDTDFPARWGYRDNSDCLYGNFSHGIWTIGASYNAGFGQLVGAQIGRDSEHYRNLIQNQVFHDLYFLPDFINKTQNLHLPMKTKEGDIYLYEKGQEIRPSLFVWQLMLNPSPLY